MNLWLLNTGALASNWIQMRWFKSKDCLFDPNIVKILITFGLSVTCALCSIGSQITTDSIVSISTTDFVGLNVVADSSGEVASMLFCGRFFSVFIFSHSIRFTLRSKMAMMAMIIVAITRPDVHITSARVPCGSPSIDTRGTELAKEVKGRKQEINNSVSVLIKSAAI